MQLCLKHEKHPKMYSNAHKSDSKAHHFHLLQAHVNLHEVSALANNAQHRLSGVYSLSSPVQGLSPLIYDFQSNNSQQAL